MLQLYEINLLFFRPYSSQPIRTCAYACSHRASDAFKLNFSTLCRACTCVHIQKKNARTWRERVSLSRVRKIRDGLYKSRDLACCRLYRAATRAFAERERLARARASDIPAACGGFATRRNPARNGIGFQAICYLTLSSRVLCVCMCLLACVYISIGEPPMRAKSCAWSQNLFW